MNEKVRVEKAVQLFLERVRVTYECDKVDQDECIADALEIINGPWMDVEHITGFAFDYMYNHCSGIYEPTLIGIFRSSEEGC